MTNHEINDALRTLGSIAIDLENAYIENEGECTELTDQMEQEINALQSLLTTEGIDSLGRWLKSREDEKKSLKAEKDYITRRMNAIDNTIDYIKEQVYSIMTATGQDKLKGSCGYSFTPTISETTEVNKDELKARYADRVTLALREACIPDYIGVTLTASSKAFAEWTPEDAEQDASIFVKVSKPTCRFTKPRAKAE